MAFGRLENTIDDVERKHNADFLPLTSESIVAPDKEKRIAPHELFTLFTATIILQNEFFVR